MFLLLTRREQVDLIDELNQAKHNSGKLAETGILFYGQ